MVCVGVVVFVCGLSKRVCVFVCGLVCGAVWYVVCAVSCVLCCCVCVSVCDRMFDGVWRVVIDCLCACGLKINNCGCALGVGFNM